MPISDFLKQEASASLRHHREKEQQQLAYEQQRKEQLYAEYSSYAEKAADVLQHDVEEAAMMVLSIREMSMPSSIQECTQMLEECSRKIAQPLKKSAAAVWMTDVPDDAELPKLDLKGPSKMIRQAWKERQNELIDYAKTNFRDVPEIETYIKQTTTQDKKERRKSHKDIWIALGILGVLIIAGAIVIVVDSVQEKHWNIEFKQAIVNQEYDKAIEMVPEQWGEDGFWSHNNDYYEKIIDAMIENGEHRKALELAVTKEFGYSSVRTYLVRIGESYLLNHSAANTKQYLKSVLPASYYDAKRVLKETNQMLNIK